MNPYQELEKQVAELKIDSKTKLVIVEGIKDKTALNNLGINNIKTLKEPLYKEIEDICKITKECILLVDLDKQGKKLYYILKKELSSNGIKIDDKFRKFLFKTTLRNIEGLTKYLNNKIIK